MAARTILLLGNPLLSQRAEPVKKDEGPAIAAVARDLHDTLMDFRARHGWGRAIAAPQIGVLKRIVYLHIDRPWLLINPAMVKVSRDTIELWDDCMSFPDLLVRVKRHRSFTLDYVDEQWEGQTLAVEGVLSELLHTRSTIWMECWRFREPSTARPLRSEVRDICSKGLRSQTAKL